MSPARPTTARTHAIALAQIALAAAMMLWPLLVAGRPTLFADTGAYWRQGRTIVVQGLRLDRGAPDPFDLTLGGQVSGHTVVRDPKIASSFIAARSPVYGLFLYVTQRLGTLWLTAAAQALAAAAVIRAAWRLAAPHAADWTYLAVMAALAAATSLPFYASFAMPDAFAGLDILIIAALTLYWDRMGRGTRAGLWGLLAVSLSFHTSHLMIAAALAPVCAVALWRLGAGRRALLIRSGAVASAIAIAAAFGAAASAGMASLAGAPAHSPPFLTARLLADGPGRAYLRRACATAEPFVLCRFKDRPLDTSDAILWWNYPDKGVFMTSPLPVRLALEAEQPRFVGAVLEDDPLGVAGAALRNFGLQLAGFYVDDPLHDPCQMTRTWYWRQSTAQVLVVDPSHCGASQALIVPPALLYALHGATLILAGFAIWGLARGRPGQGAASGPDALDDGGRLLAAAGLTLAAVLINAAVCGVLSGPFARYEARLIWLVPMLALLAACAAVKPAPARFRATGLERPARA